MKEDRRWFLTPCGLDCHGCSIRLRTDEELAYWKSQNVDTDKIRCDGCRSDRTGNHWAPKCKILQCCVYERNLEFCAQCPDFPCRSLEDWGREYEHHAKAVETLREMKKTGIEQWLVRYFAK
ncbi:MAG: DUF3795 domain-containing protein [candidate division WOR-3 bacterium]|nr:DUF3795 domain-containing protein [candidate division WOR-3 bacterium]